MQTHDDMQKKVTTKAWQDRKWVELLVISTELLLGKKKKFCKSTMGSELHA